MQLRMQAKAQTADTIVPTTTSTRLIIKNLPPHFDESNLKAHLLKESKIPLTLTDVVILRRRSDQASRKCAFVGFSTPDQAVHAIHYFHKSYCGTNRLHVEWAFRKSSTHSESSSNPLDKEIQPSSQFRSLTDQKLKSSKDTSQINQNQTRKDVQKQELLLSLQSNKRTPFWANDDAIAIETLHKDSSSKSQSLTDSNDEVKNTNNANSNDENQATNLPDEMDQLYQVEESSSTDHAIDGSSQKDQTQEPKISVSGRSDLDFLRSKTILRDDLDSDGDNDDDIDEEDLEPKISHGNSNSTNTEWVQSCSNPLVPQESQPLHASTPQTPSLTNQKAMPGSNQEKDQLGVNNNVDNRRDDDPENPHDHDKNKNDEDDETYSHNRIFIRNLPFSTTEEELEEFFQPFGKVEECYIPLDDQKRTKGYAFLSFSNSTSAASAILALDGMDFQGRLLHLMPARPNSTSCRAVTMLQDPSLSYKQKQELLRQQNASTPSQGWSASFVRGDAVVDALADRLGLRKGELLNVKDARSGDAAVLLALGETRIIQENREYFSAHGIDMEALVSLSNAHPTNATPDIQRSKTSILVKNLPFETTKDDLSQLFSKPCPPRRILLPPSRTIALVEYDHAVDAKRALTNLAYKRFKHVPLYLEWAPLAAAKGTTHDQHETADLKQITNLGQVESTTMMTVADDAAVVDEGYSHSIFVKNLNFDTTEDQLRSVFESHVPVRAVKIPVKVVPRKKNSGTYKDGEQEEPMLRSLSMGYGFVECDSEESVRKAIRVLQGALVDNHALELKRSTKSVSQRDDSTGVSTQVSKGNLRKSTKIMCRNIPFQATRKELLQLFGSFGHLKKVRLPKKFDGQHRGFAFVEFLSHQEATSAMTALSRTHLYGRHLVLEWASPEAGDSDDNGVQTIQLLRNKAKRDVERHNAIANNEERKDLAQNKKLRFTEETF